MMAASARVRSRMASATRLPIAASRPRTVALRLSSSTAVVVSGTFIWTSSSRWKPATVAAISGSGVTVAVSITRNCGHQAMLRLLPSCFTSMCRSITVTNCPS